MALSGHNFLQLKFCDNQLQYQLLTLSSQWRHCFNKYNSRTFLYFHIWSSWWLVSNVFIVSICSRAFCCWNCFFIGLGLEKQQKYAMVNNLNFINIFLLQNNIPHIFVDFIYFKNIIQKKHCVWIPREMMKWTNAFFS